MHSMAVAPSSFLLRACVLFPYNERTIERGGPQERAASHANRRAPFDGPSRVETAQHHRKEV